jgi:hypothetical protein
MNRKGWSYLPDQIIVLLHIVEGVPRLPISRRVPQTPAKIMNSITWPIQIVGDHAKIV